MDANKLKKSNIILIAEACDNHFGSLKNAKKMVVEAKKNGADVIKFQHHLPDEEMLKKVPKSKNFKLSLYEFLKKYSLKLSDHKELLLFSKKIGIQYLCTPFSFKAAKELNSIGLNWFKIGSGEFTDLPFIREVLKFKKPVIFSTGMSSIDEIKLVYNFILKNKKNEFALMNCTSEYPPRLEDININFINYMKRNFLKAVIGHSDHTNDIITSIGAAAAGARIIEKHVHLDGLNFGPDRDVSINFKQFGNMARSIRLLERSLGKEKKIYPKEKMIRKWATRSLYATKNIKKGEEITKKNMWSIRPGTGIPSRFFDKIVGSKTISKIKKGNLIKKSQLRKKI